MAWTPERLIDEVDLIAARGLPRHEFFAELAPRLRNERIIQEAGDPETAVVLLDVVLGHGAHADPATEIAAAIAQARDRSGANRHVAFVASVCGTAADPQNLQRQERTLRSAGVLLAPSNAAAARLAAQIAGRKGPAQA